MQGPDPRFAKVDYGLFLVRCFPSEAEELGRAVQVDPRLSRLRLVSTLGLGA